ncbi:LolA family protein [Halorientalis halophila]|uniref:LolA family protein n=1 Tax=Halorientalis halophila TaxID=3108499 RepID=UPI00300A429B
MASRFVTPKRLVVAVVVLVGVFGVFGLVQTGAEEPESATQIGANAAERFASIDGLNATRRTVVTGGDETHESVHRVSLRPTDGLFRERLVRGPGPANNVTVSNGSVMWWRNRHSGNVTRLDLSSTDRPTERTQGERIADLFSRLNVTESGAGTAATPTPGIDPLPSVPESGAPQGARAGETTAEMRDAAFGVRYNGTDTVDGRTVYVLSITPRNESLVDEYEQRLWVDAERFFPLKRETAWMADGERHSQTVIYENVTFDPGLSDSVFEYDSPADASVERKDQPRIDTYSSTAALRSQTNFSVPEPTLPSTFTLQYASRSDGRGITNVGLRYANATSRVTVTKATISSSSEGDWQVSIGDRSADVRVGYTNYVTWSCDGYYYKVFSEDLGPDLLIEIARSVGCE